MKCIVCGRDQIPDNLSACPDCRFPNIRIAGTGNVEEYNRAMTGMAAAYQNNCKRNTSVGLIVYSYRKNNGRLEPDGEAEKIISESIDILPEGQICWNQDQFTGFESDEPISLTIAVHGVSRSFLRTVSVKAPSARDCWQVGIVAEKELKFRLVLGMPDDYVQTEALSMVRDDRKNG